MKYKILIVILTISLVTLACSMYALYKCGLRNKEIMTELDKAKAENDELSVELDAISDELHDAKMEISAKDDEIESLMNEILKYEHSNNTADNDNDYINSEDVDNTENIDNKDSIGIDWDSIQDKAEEKGKDLAEKINDFFGR